jgi:hypothetical protein
MLKLKLTTILSSQLNATDHELCATIVILGKGQEKDNLVAVATLELQAANATMLREKEK